MFTRNTETFIVNYSLTILIHKFFAEFLLSLGNSENEDFCSNKSRRLMGAFVKGGHASFTALLHILEQY